MERKHIILGSGALTALVAVMTGILVMTSSAQTTAVACNYSFSPQTPSLTVTAGQSASASVSINASGTGCASDSVSVQVWDNSVDVQAIWPAWIAPGSTTLSNVTTSTITFTVSPPATGYLTYKPLIKIFRGSTLIATTTFDLNITPAATCPGMTLTLTNTTVDVAANGSAPSQTLNYSCTTAGAQVNTLTLQISPPGQQFSTYATHNTVWTGSFPLSTTWFGTTSGTVGVRTCINDTTCQTGTNMVTFQLNYNTSTSSTGGPTLMGTIFKSGQYQDPATGTIRTCTSPNGWMKEGTTSSGARSWHCMPNYSTTAVNDYVPSNCATAGGTLWAGTTQDGDYCSSTAPTAPTTGGTGGTTGPATSCANGSRCSSNSWCNNGSQCYYPNGDLTCVAWPMPAATSSGYAAPVANPTCPSGTSECSPTDANCVAVGQTIPYVNGKWCKNGMQYYSSDGTNMTCVQMGGSPPAGFSSCRPGDTSCIPENGYGTSSGWCSGSSTQCYQKASDSNSNNDKYCAPMPMNAMGSDVTCPSGYSVCSPTDTNCFAKGDIIPKDKTANAWCSNAQKCTLSDGTGSCAGWNESCPAGSKYCSANDTFCVEPGEYKAITSNTSGGGSYWCGGGGGMTFYSSSQAYCAPKTTSGTNTAMMMWTSADVKAILTKLGVGWGVCPPSGSSGGSQCIEPGKSGSSSGWCGWYPPNNYMNGGNSGSTTRNCPSLDGGTTVTTPTIPKPITTTCSSGQIPCASADGKSYCYSGVACPTIKQTTPGVCQTVNAPKCNGYDSPEMKDGCYTGRCVPPEKNTPRPAICPLLPSFDFCPAGQTLKTKTSPDGCSYTVCDSGDIYFPPGGDFKANILNLREQLRSGRFFLKDTEYQLKEIATETPEIKQARALVESGKTKAVELDKIFRTATPENMKSIMERWTAFQNEIMQPLYNLTPSFEVYRRCGFIRQEIKRYRDDLSRIDGIPGSGKDNISKLLKELNGIETAHKDACERADEFSLMDVEFSLEDFRQNFDGTRREINERISTSHLSNMIAGMRQGFETLRTAVGAKAIKDASLSTALEKADAQLKSCEREVNNSLYEKAKQCIEQLERLFHTVVEPLVAKYDLNINYEVRARDVFDRVFEEKLANKVNALVNEKIAKLEAMLDEKFQSVAAQLVQVTEKIQLKVDEITQAAANVVKLQETVRKQIEDSREKILTQINEVEIQNVRQQTVRATAEQAFACAARTNWVSGNGEEIRSKISSLASLMTAGTASLEDAQDALNFCETKYKQNLEDSFEAGATAFRDVATEQWYHGPAQFAFEQNFILGTKDANGNLTHEFVPVQETLWGEAIAMTVRLFNIPLGQDGQLTAKGVSSSTTAPWMYPYVNAASAYGAILAGKCMNCPISRLETATLIVQLGKLPVPATPIIAPTAYKDYGSFRVNADGAKAVDALTQEGVFQGNASGNFSPSNPLLRTEMAALLQRLTENVLAEPIPPSGG